MTKNVVVVQILYNNSSKIFKVMVNSSKFSLMELSLLRLKFNRQITLVQFGVNLLKIIKQKVNGNQIVFSRTRQKFLKHLNQRAITNHQLLAQIQ
jgi:hypothetical protein